MLPSFNSEIAIKYRLVGKNVNIIGLPLLEQRKSKKEGDETAAEKKEAKSQEIVPFGRGRFRTVHRFEHT